MMMLRKLAMEIKILTYKYSDFIKMTIVMLTITIQIS